MSVISRTGFVWHELMTGDVGDAKKFYQEVAGLTTAPGAYPMVFAGEQPVGGLVAPRGNGQQWPSGGPEAHWVAYIGVDDVDLAASRAQELGGQVLVAPIDVPEFGRAAVLRDPQGATFGVFRPLP